MSTLKYRDKTQKTLYICSTYYHVYITLMKQLTNVACMDLVICDDIPSGGQLAQRLSDMDLFQHVWFIRQSMLPEVRGKTKLDWIFFQHQRRFQTITPLLPFDVENYDDVYIFHDATPLGMYLTDAGRSYHLVEDSLNFYQRLSETAQAKHRQPHTLKFWIRKLLNSGYFPLGESRYVLDIEVNENLNLQVSGKPIIELPRKSLQNKLSQASRQKILDIFGCPELPDMDEQCALLLTEPLFADGLCGSLEEQILIYKKIAAELNRKGFQTILKPHPRDTADYSDVSVTVLERRFPIELLNYLPIPRLGCVAAISSSAINSVSAEQKILWRNIISDKTSEGKADENYEGKV